MATPIPPVASYKNENYTSLFGKQNKIYLEKGLTGFFIWKFS